MALNTKSEIPKILASKVRRYIEKYLFLLQKRRLGPLHKWNALEIAISFSIANNIVGDYLEFGVYKGASFIHAYKYYNMLFSKYQLGHKDSLSEFITQKPRFFAFDSFKGLPPTSDKSIPLTWQIPDIMSFSKQDFVKNLKKARVNLSKVEIVEGYYNSSLTKKLLKDRLLKKAAIINIDCDLYESTVEVLNLITPLVVDGTVIYFDDWFYYSGNPKKGERKAFNDWLKRNPKFTSTELCKYYPAATFIINMS